MIDDARTLPDGSEFTVDILVIGAGAAGITIASEFVGRGQQLMVVESGGLDYDREVQKLYRGRNVGHLYEPLDLCRVRTFGGSTDPRGWGGWCKPLSPIDFETRSWVPLSGWPLTRSELDPFYVRAMATLGLPADTEALAAEDSVSDDVLALNGPSVINEPCPLSPAPHLGHSHLAKLKAAADVRVLTNANVTEIVVDANATQARGVRIATLDGKSHYIAARYVVLAAGGIENARLLLLSDQVQRSGLGNASDYVGRCFMEHPRFAWGRISGKSVAHLLQRYNPGHVVGQRVLDAGTRPSLLLGASIALSETVQRREAVLGARSWILPAPSTAETSGGIEFKELVFWLKKRRVPGDWGRRVREVLADLPGAANAGYAHVAAKMRPPPWWQFVTVLEQEPNPDSRVTLDTPRDRLGQRRVRLDWRLGSLTRRTLEKSTELFAAEMNAIGVECSITGCDGWAGPDIEKPRWVWHHMGTTRMSASPKDGVVDRDCRVHGMDNLFVAGSSVFPTVGNDMPTLTVVALAHRLADTVRRESAGSTPSRLAAPKGALLNVGGK